MGDVEDVVMILYLMVELLYTGKFIEVELCCWVLPRQLFLKGVESVMEAVGGEEVRDSDAFECILPGELEDYVVGYSWYGTDDQQTHSLIIKYMIKSNTNEEILVVRFKD